MILKSIWTDKCKRVSFRLDNLQAYSTNEHEHAHVHAHTHTCTHARAYTHTHLVKSSSAVSSGVPPGAKPRNTDTLETK